MRARLMVAYLLLSGVLGCGGQSPAGSRQIEVDRARLDRAFVVFSSPRLVIDRLGIPVAAPVTVGSRPSPGTLASDTPEIVSIDASGALVAHRNGIATVRATGSDSVLQVEVRAVEAIRVDPEEVTLKAGERTRLRVFADAVELPAEAIRWGTSAPAIATVDRGEVRAGVAGRAVVVARYGEQSANSRVLVASGPGPAFSVAPSHPTLRVGEVVAFRALSPQGPLDGSATWTSGNGRVLVHLAGNVFKAAAKGEALVCAVALQRKTCTKVGVRQ